MSLKTYDPKKVSVIIGGHIVTGYADGAFVTAARNNDTWTRVGGADGEQTRAKSNDKSGRITITLMQSSNSNAVLQGFMTADETANSGLIPALIKDVNGTDICSAELGWLVKPADRGFAKENSNREWIYETSELQFVGGGIPKSTSSQAST